MKTILLTLFYLFAVISAWSQEEIPTNSYASIYKKTNLKLQYHYEADHQTHDYSNNWDIDNDGKPDQLYFVGTGGAHLYYYLKVILSSNHKIKNFPFLELDDPMLPPDTIMQQLHFNPRHDARQFAIINYHHKNCIYLKLDKATFSVAKKFLNKKGIQTNRILISYEHGNWLMMDY